jgi:AraC-like DNA-binding protein
MELELLERGAGLIRVVPALAGESALSNLVPDISMTGVGQTGKGIFEFCKRPGFSVSHCRYTFSRPAVWMARGDVSTLELRFMLGEPIVGRWEGIAQPVLLQDQFNISYTPDIETEVTFTKGVYSTLDISFENYFLENIADDFPLLSELMNEVHAGRAAEITPKHHYCSPALRAAVRSLLQHPFSRTGQNYFLDAKVVELLIGALEVIHAEPVLPSLVLTPHDIEALHEVKRRIEEDTSVALSYKQLQRCGLNENKLLNGFKKLFGTTPYQHHLELKMQKAEGMLLTTMESVTSIAYTVGYNHVSNFSLEFTKRFGCSPVEYRRRYQKI